MIISYDYGHGVGQDRGANGKVNEEAEIRKYGPIVVNELMRQGHTLIDCTPKDDTMTLQQSLSYRTNKANASGSQLHLCFHINAGGGHGAEMEVASDNGAKYAESILNEICKLGFINRGIKRPNLWVTGHTNMPCVLLEPFFCDSASDVALYNPNTLGLAIAKGIINIIGGNAKPIIKEEVKVNDNDVMPTGNNITPCNGGGWIERVADGRTILHQSRSVYLALTPDGHLNFTANGTTTKLV